MTRQSDQDPSQPACAGFVRAVPHILGHRPTGGITITAYRADGTATMHHRDRAGLRLNGPLGGVPMTSEHVRATVIGYTLGDKPHLPKVPHPDRKLIPLMAAVCQQLSNMGVEVHQVVAYGPWWTCECTGGQLDWLPPTNGESPGDIDVGRHACDLITGTPADLTPADKAALAEAIGDFEVSDVARHQAMHGDAAAQMRMWMQVLSYTQVDAGKEGPAAHAAFAAWQAGQPDMAAELLDVAVTETDLVQEMHHHLARHTDPAEYRHQHPA